MAHRRALLALAACAIAVFLALTALVIVGHSGGLDYAARRWMRSHYDPSFNTAAQIVTQVLSPLVDTIVLVAAAAITARRRRSVEPLAVALAMICVTGVIVVGTKYGIDRPPTGNPLLSSGGRSFPSGHTAATLTFLGAAVMVAVPRGRRRQLLIVAVAGLTAVCAVSLVYARFHWLTDTLASAALGVALLALLRYAEDVSRSREQPRRSASPTRSRHS